jgi:hypothetical protein
MFSLAVILKAIKLDKNTKGVTVLGKKKGSRTDFETF